MVNITDDEIRTDVKTRTPDAAKEIDSIETFGTLNEEDYEKTICQDVETLRQSKVLAGLEIRGLSMDTFSGIVTELDIKDDTPVGRL